MSYIGTNEIGKMFLGTTEIGKAYLGSELVYDSAGSSPYTPLSYVKFTGSQYLKFNYYTKPATHIEIDMQFEANGNASSDSEKNNWLGTYENSSGAFYSNFGGGAAQYNKLFYWFNKGYVSGIWEQEYSNIYNRSTWVYNNNKVTFQGVAKTTETKTTTQDGKLMLNAHKPRSGALSVFNRHNLIVYSMKIYEGNNLLLDLVPKTDGVNNGLYDNVNNVFYTSETNTNLIGA